MIKNKNTSRGKKILLKYTVTLEPQPEGGFTVLVPALPGCITEGDTEKTALKNAKEAIELYIEDLIAEDEPIPVDIKPLNRFIFLQTTISGSQTPLLKA